MTQSPDELIFGIHAITETLLAGKSISKIWLKDTLYHPAKQKLLHLARKRSIPCSKVPLAKLHRLTSCNHQGAIAWLAPIDFVPLDPVIATAYHAGKYPLLVLLDQIQDGHNMGAIARTALATHVDALVIGTQNSISISGGVMKASAGALAHIPVCRVSDLGQAIQEVQQHGLQVIACVEKASQTIYQASFNQPTAFLLGGEGTGIASSYLKMADMQVRIPMTGPIASLNVSVAAGVVLYEVMRQRLPKKNLKI